MIVRLVEDAAAEAIEAAGWYEGQRPGLGQEFNDALQAVLDLLTDDIVPLRRMPGRLGARGAEQLGLKRFPYNLVVLRQTNVTTVVAVAHHSRRPGYWIERLDM